MKSWLLILLVILVGRTANAQKVDSLFFNLYTDSLKKGVYNYINVDAKLANGQWVPLTSKELNFTSTAGVFEGNSLIIDTSYKGEKVIIKATLKTNPSISREITIYIKKFHLDEKLKTVDELMGKPSRNPRNNKGAP